MGARSLVDWVAARLDVTRETARDLARVARSDDVDDLVAGEVSFDRAVVRRRLVEVGACKEMITESDRFDLAGARRLVARHRRLLRSDEHRAVQDRGIVFEESYDHEVMRFWGQLPARPGRVVRGALDQVGDTVPRDAAPTRAQRAADALVMLCQGARPDTQPAATVIVDARVAAPSNGQAGVAVLNGSKTGAETLEAILCDGIIEVVGVTGDGTPLGIGTASARIPPRLRRFVLGRDDGCVVPADGQWTGVSARLRGHGAGAVRRGVNRPLTRRKGLGDRVLPWWRLTNE